MKGYYQQTFNREVLVKLQLAENNQDVLDEFMEKIEQENNEAIQQLMAAAPSEPEPEPDDSGDEPVRLAIGYDIRDEIIPLMNVVDEEKRLPFKVWYLTLTSRNCVMEARCLFSI